MPSLGPSSTVSGKADPGPIADRRGKTARQCGVGVGTVQRTAREMSRAPFRQKCRSPARSAVWLARVKMITKRQRVRCGRGWHGGRRNVLLGARPQKYAEVPLTVDPQKVRKAHCLMRWRLNGHCKSERWCT